MAECYSGPSPIRDTKDSSEIEKRMAIWKWAVEHGGIAGGRSYEDVHKAINSQFFQGRARPEWITDILSGRKTPYRELSDKMYAAQYYRRQITQQAQQVARGQAIDPKLKPFTTAWDKFGPRALALTFHDVAFPVTHAGDLLLRPESWKIWAGNAAKTWALRGRQFTGRGKENAAFTERQWSGVKGDKLFELALHSGVDLSERAHGGEELARSGKAGINEMAWTQLKVMRFELWKSKVSKMLEDGMTQAEMLDIGKNMATWANHATGSAKGGLANLKLPIIGDPLFGSKLTQSKLNRLFLDPAQTAVTIGRTLNEHTGRVFASWKTRHPQCEKAAAWTRLEGSAQYISTYAAGLLVNQALLSATHQKDKNGDPLEINWKDPTKGDWMKFKGFGWEVGLPGMHSELKALGALLAVTFYHDKVVSPKNHDSIDKLWGKTLYDWGSAKLAPQWQLASEIARGKGFPERPVPFQMPWYSKEHPKTITPFQ